MLKTLILSYQKFNKTLTEVEYKKSLHEKGNRED